MSERTATERPVCHSDDGHAFVGGRLEMNDEGEPEIVSRQCRRCGFEEEIPR